MFSEAAEEDEDRQGSEETIDSGSEKLNGYGIIPFILKFCEVTNHNLEEAMDYDISLLFYIVSYEILKAKEQEKQIKRIQNRQWK